MIGPGYPMPSSKEGIKQGLDIDDPQRIDLLHHQGSVRRGCQRKRLA
jgi:hypothetical protein